jgi:hypothetical protein
MGCYSKAVLFPDPGLNGSDYIICKLNDPAAADTSEVAVMFVAIDVLIVEMAVLEIDFLNQSAVDEEGDSPVEGGLGDSFLLVSQPQKEFIHVEVIVDGKDFLNDRLSLRGVSHPLFLDVFPELLDGIHDHTITIEIHYQ